ncbi:Sodium/solute symporter superfamily [Sesbania bispinosa]|nr:Sodium/solute symporter superfamily [Sesbania bispinosa]
MGDFPIPACYPVSILNPNRIWKTDNVMKTELPILSFQIVFTILLSRLFFFVYKPFHQPRLISQISVGFLLTPPLLGRFTAIFEFVFPVNGVLNIEVLAHIGLIYYAFLSGLEMNINTILQVKKKAGTIAIAGIIFPMVLGPAFYALHRIYYVTSPTTRLEECTINAFLLWTLILTVTGFPVLAHILSELKLLYTNLGKTALTAAMISDTYGWVLFTLLVPFSINGQRAVYSVLSTMIFIIVLVFVIFSVSTYAVNASAVLLMTVIVSPIINAMYRPRKRFEQNKLKTIQKLRVDAELRILACVHNNRQATGMISIIESFNATRLSPIHVFALYLVELTGRAAALVAAHLEKPSNQPGAQNQNLTRSQAELESINNTFEAFVEVYDAVRVQTLNVVSAYATIHEDIYNAANEKRTSLILLPFHKHMSSEGTLETTSVVYKDINQNVMQDAPCSVGIFVDRDLGSLPKMNFRILMIFVGGPDDREALAVAWRMAGHPGIRLSVVRILLFDEAAEVDTSTHGEAHGILSAVMDSEKQKELDDEYVNSFRLTAVNNDDSITYTEVDVHTGEDIPAVLNELEKIGCDLYIVGQGNCRGSRVFSNLLEWCDCTELGVIGDILASNNFGSSSSVLVVQQYGYGGMVFGKPSNVATNNDGFESLVVKTE